MTSKKKCVSLLFLFGAFVSLIMLSASLSNLEFLPGSPFPGASNSEDARFVYQVVPQLAIYAPPFLEGLLAFVFSGMLIYITFRSLKFVKLKEILRLMLILGILVLVLALLPRTPINQVVTDPGIYTEIATPPPETYAITPLGAPPSFLIWLTSIIFILGLSIPAFQFVRQRFQLGKTDDPILREAEIAAAALVDGHNFADVIMHCYFEMANAILIEQGISRTRNLTVREFEQQLDELGFPSQPVEILTALFEKVRYGIDTINAGDEELALSSLNAIIRYCQEGSQPANEANR